jgi:hypothetical protein
VELELQGVLKLVVLLYLKKQQGCDVRGWRGCNMRLNGKHDMT